MDAPHGMDSLDELKDLGLRPKEFVAKKTAVAYGTALLAGGTLCANLYTEPSFVNPCDGRVVLDNSFAIVTSTSSVAWHSAVPIVATASPNAMVGHASLSVKVHAKLSGKIIVRAPEDMTG